MTAFEKRIESNVLKGEVSIQGSSPSIKDQNLFYFH